jgi:Protein of unknown function (DUF2695)
MFTSMEADRDHDLISSITPDVMTCLERSGFFHKLDDLLSPEHHSQSRADCSGDYRLSKSVLQAVGFDSSELTDIFGVLGSQGGGCDCEILYNVAESSRLKSEYWRNRAKGLEVHAKHVPHSRPGQ